MAKAPTAAPLSNYMIDENTTASVEGEHLVLRINISEQARNAAPPSKSGKLHLVANSGGWSKLPLFGLRLNLGLGFAK